MQAVIYTRVSLDRHGGRSVEDQERECRAECDRRGWTVRAVYCDKSISASRYGRRRPEWERAKQALKADDVLVLWEASRSTRDLEEWVRLRNICAELGVLVSYSGRVLDLSRGDDRFTGGLDALLAERESEQFRERVLRGKRSAARDGRPHGRPSWGYRIVSTGARELDPVEAPRVREAAVRFIAGESLNSIWTWLVESEGYTPSSRAMIRQALASPTIAGLRVHRGEVVGKATWPAIITETQHQQIKARMRSRKSGRKNSGSEPRRLLSGIAKCGSEGCPAGYVTWRRRAHGTPTYVCPRGHVSRLADPLDREVEKRLFEILSQVDPRQFEDEDPITKQIWDEIESLEDERARWRELALQKKVTPESFAIFEQDLVTRIGQLEARTLPPDFSNADLANLRANWEETPMREKRRIVDGFLSITIVPSRSGVKVGDALGVVITPI